MTKAEEMKAELLQWLDENEDVLSDILEQMDDWDGYLGEDRCWPMSMLDDVFYGASVFDILHGIDFSEFDEDDEYYYDSIWGIRSVDNRYDVYKDYITQGLIDNIIDRRGRLRLDDEFEEMLDDYEECLAEEDDEE